MFSTLTTVELLLKVAPLCTECRDWVQAELLHAGGGEALGRGIRAADVAAEIHVALLQIFAAVPGARVLLRPAAYVLMAGDERNAAHLLNGLREWHVRLNGTWPTPGSEGYDEARAAYDAWRPQWRPGFGPMEIAAGVTVVGQEGVVLSGEQARLEVRAEGVRFESVDLPRSVRIDRGSVSMETCTSTGGQISVRPGASVAMEDCRIFGSDGIGVARWRRCAAPSRVTEAAACVSLAIEGRSSW